MGLKLIYVDIDGPLATDGCEKTTYETKWHKKLYRMNPDCVAILNEVLNSTGADMIVSSDWRRPFNLEQLGEIFEWNNIIKKPIGITSFETISFGNLALNRIHQIKLSVAELEPEKWVAIDDLNLSTSYGEVSGLKNYVMIDPIEGLTGKNKKVELLKYLQ